MPDPDPDWHPAATAWFESLGQSGQSVHYEASDWATAWLVAEAMSRELKPQGLVYKGEVVSYESMTVRPSALQSFLKAATALMATEGDRRRLRLELQQASEEEAPDVSELDEFRRRRGVG